MGVLDEEGQFENEQRKASGDSSFDGRLFRAYASLAARQKPAAERPSPSPTVLRPKPMPAERTTPAAPKAEAQAEAGRPAPAAPVGAEPPMVLALLSSIALLFLVGWRVARHHGPG
jgi:hypothetical protein